MMIRLLIEDKRGNIVRLLGLDREVADWLHGLNPEWSFFLGKMYKEAYDAWEINREKRKKTIRKRYESDVYSDLNNRQRAARANAEFNWRVQKSPDKATKDVKMFHKFLTQNPGEFGNVKNLNLKAVKSYIKEYRKKQKVAAASKYSEQAILKFDDGYFWHDTKSNKCETWIKNKMQHCGQDSRGHLQILFDDKLEPHGTLIWGKESNRMAQAVGKQNRSPERKYWKYFGEFVKEFGITYVDHKVAGGYTDEEFLSFLRDHMPDEGRDRVQRVVDEEGTVRYYKGNQLHREGGPAYEHIGGTKQWHINGKLHREDGPAIEHYDGTGEYWLNDKLMSKEEWQQATGNLQESHWLWEQMING